ncbi:hypothetical protein DRN69_00135 [Candidatus Pacearchaeota archaeon]|nr:MAG: hypothetical protein DRN69_00135 [Candidatus Pacearchaeota archaeon]
MSFARDLIYSKFGKDINKIVKKHPDIKEELEKLILEVYKYGYDKGYNTGYDDGWSDAEEEGATESEPFEHELWADTYSD